MVRLSLHTNQVACQVRAYPDFYSMKWPGVLIFYPAPHQVGCMSIVGLHPASRLPAPIYTPGCREALWEWSVFPKNPIIIQWPWSRLEPSLIDLEMSQPTVTWGQRASPLNMLRIRISSYSHPDFSTLPFLSVLVSVDPSELATPLLDTKGTVACNAEVTDDRNCWVAPSYRSKAIWYAINVWSFCCNEEKNKSVNFPDQAVELVAWQCGYCTCKWLGTGHKNVGTPDWTCPL